ncbi:unnamed protein product [Anisakis simplex]|uniref:7TM_GPCR_Srx domain-containing protein n=1 Tax=Anisakis simplex TaxID=6269 RepID=A0A0M3IZ17_ANISI|nr:unnamed protein product [Anisakis simplex]
MSSFGSDYHPSVDTNSSAIQRGLRPIFFVFAFQGLLLVVTNGTLSYVIAKHSILRRRYTVQLAEITINAIMGVGLSTAGIGRIIITFVEPVDNYSKSRRYCMLMPWNILAAWCVLRNVHVLNLHIT